MRIVFETENKEFRIIELEDTLGSLESLKGDIYNPEVNSDIPREQLEKEEREFERLVESEGVYGYVLERWNPKPDKGYEHIDSCYGFVGRYDPKVNKFSHFIVDEMKQLIDSLVKESA